MVALTVPAACSSRRGQMAAGAGHAARNCSVHCGTMKEGTKSRCHASDQAAGKGNAHVSSMMCPFTARQSSASCTFRSALGPSAMQTPTSSICGKAVHNRCEAGSCWACHATAAPACLAYIPVLTGSQCNKLLQAPIMLPNKYPCLA
jgi:hypothetical protein